MADLRAMIRELLAEEIAALRTEMSGARQEERVRISSSDDLTRFAQSIVRRASDPGFVTALHEGRLCFCLETPVSAVPAPVAVQPAMLVTSVPTPVAELMKPLVTERDIAGIAEGQTRLRVGRHCRLTPLAADEARRRGIRIERRET